MFLTSHRSNRFLFSIFAVSLITFLQFLGGCIPDDPGFRTATVSSKSPALPSATNTFPITTPSIDVTSTPPIKATDPTAILTTISTETFLPPTPTATLYDPSNWQSLPVVPLVDKDMVDLYQMGQQLGNDPHAFSKIGDCETAANWFLQNFDRGPNQYNLGPYSSLQPVIDYYKGSFARSSQAARPGFTVASVLNPYWADAKACKSNESPLDCELRLHHPSIAFIMLGTNDITFKKRATFEKKLQEIVDKLLERGVIPILATKSDNLEGDHSINLFVAQLAIRNRIPLWNFWAAIQSLPDRGLQEDGVHLTWAPDDFGDPNSMSRAWPIRNLTALQMLAAIWQDVSPGD